MPTKEIHNGSIIIITDIKDPYYLHIGEVIKVQSGTYIVRFGYTFELEKEITETYGTDLKEKCKVVAE